MVGENGKKAELGATDGGGAGAVVDKDGEKAGLDGVDG